MILWLGEMDSVAVCVCVFTHCVLHSMCDRREDTFARSRSARRRLRRAGRVSVSTFTSSLSPLICSLFLFLCLLAYRGPVETQSLSRLRPNWGQALTCAQIHTAVKTWEEEKNESVKGNNWRHTHWGGGTAQKIFSPWTPTCPAFFFLLKWPLHTHTRTHAHTQISNSKKTLLLSTSFFVL